MSMKETGRMEGRVRGLYAGSKGWAAIVSKKGRDKEDCWILILSA